MVLFYYLTRA